MPSTSGKQKIPI